MLRSHEKNIIPMHLYRSVVIIFRNWMSEPWKEFAALFWPDNIFPDYCLFTMSMTSAFVALSVARVGHLARDNVTILFPRETMNDYHI